jgi:glucose/arabinose dehydrogenase
MVGRRALTTSLILLTAVAMAGESSAQKKKGKKAEQKKGRREATAAEEEPYYRMVSFPYDSKSPLEVGAMACLKDGRLLIGTRTGDVWMLSNPYVKDTKKAEFKRWARGLAQPLGFVEYQGWIYTAQRGELTRMKDSDGDGRADVFENVCDDWEISGNYHEYNFGPRLDKNGQMWITTNKPFGSQPLGKAHWRGWALTVDPKTGKMKPMCAGLRSPAGVEVSPWGDAFYTDNQGEWCNASKLSHLEFGDFHGHPHGLITKKLAGEPFASIPEPKSGTYMKDLHKQIPSFKMPAVWLPYDKMGKSPSGMCWDTSGGKFGPFDGQLFIGDQHHATVMRVCLEKIDGHWQGACFRFRRDFQCGIIRICWGQDHSLFAGMSKAGWGSKGSKNWGLQRVEWTGKVPMEILSMHAKPDGFELKFTMPLDPKTAGDAARYQFESYTYKLRKNYGGPEDDKKTLKVTDVEVAKDRRSVRVKVTPLRKGYVHELYLDDLKSKDGKPILHPWAYYTLVNIPKK